MQPVEAGGRTAPGQMGLIVSSHNVVALNCPPRVRFGFGETLANGEYQAVIYAIAVIPEIQGKGVGKLILPTMLDRTPTGNVILDASPGKGDFSQRLVFRNRKIGMPLFTNAAAMADNGITEYVA